MFDSCNDEFPDPIAEDELNYLIDELFKNGYQQLVGSLKTGHIYGSADRYLWQGLTFDLNNQFCKSRRSFEVISSVYAVYREG